MKKRAETSFPEEITRATCRAICEAEVRLPPDVMELLHRAERAESDPVACSELKNILENVRIAGELEVPICQDTGVPVIYLTLPPTLPFTQDLIMALRAGVRMATAKVPLRPNVVDPLSRINTGDNTGEGMPVVHVRPGDALEITVLPKGAGAENVSRIAMLLPSRKEDIKRFVVETVVLAGGRPCPPVVLGVGIGGTFDGAAALAKEALLLPLDTMDHYEQEVCDAVNELGIGPMGLGGDTTALAVKVKQADCHTASLPVAVNVQCWACRRACAGVGVPE